MTKDPESQSLARCTSAREVTQLAREGNLAASSLFASLGRNLGSLTASLANLLNVELGIFAGGLSGAWDLFSRSLEQELDRRALAIARDRISVVRGSLEDTAGLVGAASLAYARPTH
jgi:glucokinase